MNMISLTTISTTVMHRNMKYSAGVRRHSGRFNVQGLQYKQKQLDV